MGIPQSKPQERVNHINRELSSLRNSLRISKSNLSQEKRNSIVKNLAEQSTEVKSFTGKISQKRIDDTLKKIGDTMQEVLEEDRNGSNHPTSIDSELVTRRNTSSNSSTRSNKSIKSRKASTALEKQKRQSIPTLMDIEIKFYDLRPKISNAIENQDVHLLRIYQSTLKTIASDMEMIETILQTPMDDLKNKLSKHLTNQYQKITKALKEFKRNDNLQYLSKQARKSKALKELGEIEMQLAQTESLMDQMAKEKDEVDFSIIRNNLVKINDKLRAVDCGEVEVKEKAVELTQKFKEIVKNNDSLMSKRDFDYNFSQSVQKLELLINTFDANTDKHHFLNNLENLRQCVENLEDFNETTKTKKKNLLDQINKHLKEIRSYLRHSQQSVDGQTIQQIVEDNVELRKKKAKSSDREHTVIDQFYNYWTNVKNNFNINSYSNISLLRLDGILEEMQSSIMDIREEIAVKCDLKYTLDRKHSQSMPRLTLNKHNSAYGSHRSLNQINENSEIIKTKVKMYHLSTPELLNAQKDFIDENHENKRFSKIEEIKTQVYYIKEKINEHHNKNLLRDKLEHYLKTLNVFLKDSNKIVANNANIVASEIHELIHRLYLADIKENLQILAKRAENFQGNQFDKDFEEIRENLVKLQVTLENIAIPPQYSQLEKEKNVMLDAIFYHTQSLENKVVYYQTHDENVTKMRNRLVKARDQIQRFTGVHKGPLYNAIERDLNKILMDLECIDDKAVASEITRDVEKYLKILEEKASTAQSFRGEQDLVKPLLKVPSTTNIKEDLINIRTEIDKTCDNNQNALHGLQSRLDLVNLELGQISARSNENLLKEKDIFTNEVETLRNVVEAKITLGQQPSFPMWPTDSRNSEVVVKKNDVTKEMENIYKRFENIKSKVTKNQNKRNEDTINELQKLLTELDKFRFIRNTDLDHQKLKLYNEIVNLKDEIDKHYKEEQTLGKVENTLGQIENALAGTSQPLDFIKMTDDIQSVQKKLVSLKHNHSLRDRKISCEGKTQDLIYHIKNLQEKQHNEELAKIQAAKNTFANVEEELKILKQKISAFVGLKSDDPFYELDQTITKLIITLDRVETTETLKKRKIDILKELHHQGKVLAERAFQVGEIVQLEQNLNKVSTLTKEFSGDLEDYAEIKKIVEELGKKVHSVRCSNDLVLRKNACVENYSVLFNKVLAMGNSIRSNPILSESSKIKNNSGAITNDFNSVKVSDSDNKDVSKGVTQKVYNFLDKQSTSEILAQVEKELHECKPKIDAFCDVQQSLEFQDIDDVLTRLTMKLNRIEGPKNSDVDNKKFELMQLIEDFSVMLEIKAEDAETISQIEVTLQSIGDQMKSTLTHDIVERIDETLIEMQIKLGKVKNADLKQRKDACTMSIILFMGQLSEFKQHVKSTAV